ncbi:MAG: hypothetical protein M3082_18965 [Candidatus Dormibacteraeota bacterium]|nr:hypothetical protein [Candidatus Dormibacteraeota bacterium]
MQVESAFDGHEHTDASRSQTALYAVGVGKSEERGKAAGLALGVDFPAEVGP